MKSISLQALPLVSVAALAATTALAHHSWSADYDLTRTTQVSGTVASVLFRNPHSAILVDVPSDEGRSERWTVEWASPQRLRDRGITERSIELGETLSIAGNPHRDPDVNFVRAVSLHRADGTEVGSRETEARPQPGAPGASRR